MRAPLFAALLAASALAGCLGFDIAVRPEAAATLGEATGAVFYNGTVWTADEDRPWATAVALEGERIVAVGDDAEVLRARLGERPFRVDLHGAMLLPGFHDTHSHFIREARAWNMQASPQNPFEPWPPGWDPVTGTLGQQQTGAGHVMRWANGNLARAQAGEPPAPPQTHEHAFPEGRLHANDLGTEEPAARSFAEEAASFRVAVETAASFGLTSHVEAGSRLATMEFLERFDRDQGLAGRFHLYLFPEDLDEAIGRGVAAGWGDDDAQVLGMKIYSDGWLGPRTAALREPYNDRPHRGFAFFTQEEVDAWVARAHQAGLKVTAHTIGDRAVDMLLTAYERALEAGCPDANLAVCGDPRFSLEHAQLVQPDLLARMVALDLVPSIQLSFATSDAPWAERALGAQRLVHAYPWKSMVDAGLVVGGSSDFPIEVLPPLWGLQRVVTRVDLNGQPEGGFHPEQALALEEALRTITVNAAYLEFREHDVGSIEAGKLADLVVLDRNLFAIEPDEISQARVLVTMVGGRAVHVAPGFPGNL